MTTFNVGVTYGVIANELGGTSPVSGALVLAAFVFGNVVALPTGLPMDGVDSTLAGLASPAGALSGVLTLLAGHPLQCPRAAGATARKWCNTPRDNPQSSEHNSERPGSSTNSASHLQITCNTSVRSRTHQGGPARPCRYSHPTSGAPAFRSGNRAAWVNCALGSFRLSSRCSECLR